MKWPWWSKVAVGYAAVVPMLALGNLARGDSGPRSGQLLAVGAALVATGLIVTGLRLRLAGRRRLGSGLVALGVFPASALVVFWWFPPVAAIGLLAVVVTALAAADAVAADPGRVATTS